MLVSKESSRKTESLKEPGIFCYRHSNMRESKYDKMNKQSRKIALQNCSVQ